MYNLRDELLEHDERARLKCERSHRDSGAIEIMWPDGDQAFSPVAEVVDFKSESTDASIETLGGFHVW